MKDLPPTRITFKDSIKIILCYAIIIGILMFINTVCLNLGDTKFGKSGWILYWPMWGIPYSIPLIFSLICSRLFKLSRKSSNIVCYLELFIISLMIEAYWIFDLDSLLLGLSAIMLSLMGLIIIFTTMILFLRFKLTNIKYILLFILITLSTVISAYYYFIFRANTQLSLWNSPSDSSDIYVIAVQYDRGKCFSQSDLDALTKREALIGFSSGYLEGVLDQEWRGTGYFRVAYKYPPGMNIKIIEEQLKNRFKQNNNLVGISRECKIAIVDDIGYSASLN